jgi:hypothetical protein
VPSLPELQRRFVRELRDPHRAGPVGLDVYRNTIAANYRNALGATFPVAKELVGAAFFNTAVDAFVIADPPVSGDLNVYGDRFGDFLAGYPPAGELKYLPDVARLEWALDEAARGAEAAATPGEVISALASLASEKVAGCHLGLHPSCRLIFFHSPAFHIWRMHQLGQWLKSIDLGAASTERLLVRREDGRVVAERVGPGEFAWLCALRDGLDLTTAVACAESADPAFDIGTVLATRVPDGTVATLRVA